MEYTDKSADKPTQMYAEIAEIDRRINDAEVGEIPATLRQELGLCPRPIDIVAANEGKIRGYVAYVKANGSKEPQDSYRVSQFEGLLKQLDSVKLEQYLDAASL